MGKDREIGLDVHILAQLSIIHSVIQQSQKNGGMYFQKFVHWNFDFESCFSRVGF